MHISQNEKVDLKSIVMDEDATQLNEVVVTEQKQLFEQRIDRLVVNVGSSVTSAGGTALEVLEHSPGITSSQAHLARHGPTSRQAHRDTYTQIEFLPGMPTFV